MSVYSPAVSDGLKVGLADTFALDGFGRLRVSFAQLRLSTQFDTDKRPLVWDEAVVAGGVATHLINERSVQMQVTASGDSVIRQTKEYYVYRAAQPQTLFASFAFAAVEANLVQEVGYYEGDDGIFLRANGTTIEMVLRTSTSGSAVDGAVARADWSIDSMDGKGISRADLDFTMTQILLVDLQWLGVGRVRVGFDVDGVFIKAHEFLNAGVLPVVYMKTPKLPVRYRIAATGAIGGATSLKQICSAVIREGGDNEPDTQREIDSGTSTIVVATAWETVLGVRLRSANIRATLRLVGAEYLNEDTSDPVQFAVILNPAGAGAASWADVPQTGAIAQLSRSNIAITVDGNGDASSGVVFPLGALVPASTGGRGAPASSEIEETLPIVADIAGTPDECWIVARATTGTAPVRAILQYDEIR